MKEREGGGGGGMRILINNKVVRYLTEGPHFIALCK